ncbi:MAG: type II toxin-antitoxin system death-on-curing family toxin [Cyanobacteria bacterium P01_F01_bin.53]
MCCSYAYHLCNAHAFFDGNKRIAAAISEVFLMINGWQLTLDNRELVQLFLEIADSRLTREGVENIFVSHVVQNLGR